MWHPAKLSPFTVVNGQQTTALGEADVELTVKLNSDVQSILLMGVLHVPEATVNLISTRQAIVGGCQVIFTEDRFSVSKGATTFMEGSSQEDDLMVIRPVKHQQLLWQQAGKLQSCGTDALNTLATTTFLSCQGQANGGRHCDNSS